MPTFSSSSAWPSPASSNFTPPPAIQHPLRSQHARTGHSPAVYPSPTTSSPSSARYLDVDDADDHQPLPTSSKVPCFPPGSPVTPPNHRPNHVHLNDPFTDPSAAVTKHRGLFVRNEAFRPFRASRIVTQSPQIQTHQIQHAGAACPHFPPLASADRSPASPITPASLSSSPSSASPSLPPPSTPRHRYSLSTPGTSRAYPYLTHSDSVSSFASSRLPAARLASPFVDPSTPSPRSHASHSHRPSHRAYVHRRGIIPQPARPTLAMSMQIHAPSPVMSSHTRSSAGRRSRSRPPANSRPPSPPIQTSPLPSIPQRPPMTRPPSRSERLLRDTLRRAEEYDRVAVPALSPRLLGVPLPTNGALPTTPKRHRRSISSVETSSCDDCDYFFELRAGTIDEREGELDGPDGKLWRTGSGSSSSSGYGQGYTYQARPAGLTRNKSLNGHGAQTPDGAGRAPQMAYGTPSSPSPARPQRASLPAAPRSPCAVHMPPGTRVSLDGERAPCTCYAGGMTPHEAVLRTRLEGVLRSAKEQERRTQSVERRDKEHGLSSGSGSGSGNSMASSRNLSAEGDFFFGANVDSSVTSLASNDSKQHARSRTGPAARRAPKDLKLARAPPHSPGASERSLGSPASHKSGGATPLTPPPSPPFNARDAAALCRTIDGYVSFANIEGLGVPAGDDGDSDEDEDAKARGRWWQWLSIPAGRGRGRSESACSAASR